VSHRVTASSIAFALLALSCDAPPPPPLPAEPPADAGHEAWVKRALPALRGRRPEGTREVRTLVALVEATDRETVARAMASGDEHVDRWADWFLDELQVDRTMWRATPSCYRDRLLPDDRGELATHIRDHGPLEPYGETFSMADVLDSSLLLDDVTPIYRANLFAMLARPVDMPRNPPEQWDAQQRAFHGHLFERVYLDRDPQCFGCHNGEYSVTDASEPGEVDRFHPIDGNAERALLGVALAGGSGAPMWRITRLRGVVVERGGTTPWGMRPSCGLFHPPADVEPDALQPFGYLAGELEETASVWDAEAMLATGVASLRDDGAIIEGVYRTIVEEQTMAFMLAAAVANRVWEEVMGHPLTIAHGFPRNPAQRAVLESLASTVIGSGFSLRELLVAIVTHEAFNPQAPDESTAETPHAQAPLFNPWSADEPERRGNDLGDRLQRPQMRGLVQTAYHSLDWGAVVAFPSALSEEALQQTALGFRLNYFQARQRALDLQAMLTWERRFAACEPPARRWERHPIIDSAPGSCAGFCTSVRDDRACACDLACQAHGDCCADLETVCLDEFDRWQEPDPPSEPMPADWIDRLVVAAEAREGTTVREVAVALKDRLLTEASIADEEAALIAALFGIPSLDARLDEATGWHAGVRSYCGVLLQAPQFQLAGAVAEDQEALPALEVPGSAFTDHCAVWGSILEGTGRRLECAGDTVTVVAAP